MMALFRRRQAWRPRSGPRRRERRARPEAEALDSRLLMASGHHHARPAVADLSTRVAEALKPYLDQNLIPGISVAVVSHGRVALAQGYGRSNVKAGTLVTADTRFDIGSITKTFTAVGVLELYQESQGTSHPLDLNAPISDYLHNTPSFRLPRKWAHVTTMELLNMTSGIGNAASTLPWQAQVATVAKGPLLYPPGTKTSYSDTNFDLLGELIEQWTGKPYGTFIQDQILAPLGMTQTEELGRSATVANQAVGYDASVHGRWPRAAMQDGPQMYAAAGMVSTAQDMASYMQALLSDRLLDPATTQLMWTATPTPQYGVKGTPDAERGLGWDLVSDTDRNGNTTAGPTKVEKGGSIPGFISELILYPAADSGVFVSINTNPQGSRHPNSVSALQVAEAVAAASR